MGDVVSLRRHRKAAERVKRQDEAAENRVKFGRTKAEKQLAAATEKLEAARHAGHRLEPHEDDKP